MLKRFSHSVRLLGVFGAVALLAGCGTLRAHRGAVLDLQLLSTIQAGVDNKDSVAKTLGRPTFTGQFTPDDWYYVSRDTTQFAFRNPRISKQSVALVRFDPAGNVKSVERFGKEWAMNVNPVRDITPTLGRKRGFFEELFSTIGAVGAAPGQDQSQ